MSYPFTGGIIRGRFPYVSHETLQIVLEYRNVQGNGQIIIGIDRIRNCMTVVFMQPTTGAVPGEEFFLIM
jgi:hypothetical protein